MPSNYLSGIFGQSPVRPLQRHMGQVLACVAELVQFVESSAAGDEAAMRERQAKVARLENDADKLKKELRMHLPKGLFMPVARRDLLEVLTMQDRIANRAKDIAGLMLGRRMQMPESIRADFGVFVERCRDACEQANVIVNELDELVETGFRGHEVGRVESMLEELDRIEKETDQLQVKVRDGLFEIEKSLDPIDVMFLYRVIDWTGDLGDRAQRVGSRLQLMLAR